MKKLIKGVLFLAIVGTVIVGCDKQSNLNPQSNSNSKVISGNESLEKLSANESNSFKLISPSGNKLAENINDLATKMNIKSADLVIKDIKYHESKVYSVAIVDFETDNEFQSILVLLKLDKNYTTLINKHNVTFRLKSKSDKKHTPLIDEHDVTLNDGKTLSVSKHVITVKKKNTPEMEATPYYVCDGSCCGWSQDGSSSFNCGCPSAFDISTSDGCGIRVKTPME